MGFVVRYNSCFDSIITLSEIISVMVLSYVVFTTEQERIDQIQALLEVAGIETRQRRTKGDGVMAACGQLGDPSQRKHASRSQPQR